MLFARNPPPLSQPTVAKSYMSDITDSTNESVAFTMIGVVFGVGSFLGPLIGGVLSMPAEK